MSESSVEPHPVAFFSYAHDDDKNDEGRLRALCDALVRELSLRTTREFKIFFDRVNIKPGDHWPDEIEQSLTTSTFLIPVLTPRYFERDRCRTELEAFFKREDQLRKSGSAQKNLVLPIYYVECSQLENEKEQAADPLATKVAERQRVDLRELRTRQLDDPLVREQVSALANKLHEAFRTVPPPPPAPPPQPPSGRRKPRRWLWWPGRVLLIILVLALVVVAAISLSTPSGPQDGAPDPSGPTLTVAYEWVGREETNFKMVVNAFEDENPEIGQVDGEVTDDDKEEWLRERIAGGNPPDVAFVSNPGLLRELAEDGLLKPIDEIAGPKLDDYYSQAWRELVSGGDDRLYGVPFKAANKSLVWYNAEAFKNAGVQEPESWRGLLEAADELADAGLAPFTIGGADSWVLTDILENIYLRDAGTEAYEQLSAHGLPWTHSTVRNALSKFAKVARDGWLVDGAVGASDTGFEASIEQIYTYPPQAGMLFGSDYVAGNLPLRMRPDDASFFPFPQVAIRKGPVVVGGDFAVLLTDNPAARKFINYLATPQAAEVWAGEGGMLSPNQAVPAQAYRDDVSRRAAGLLKDSPVYFDLSDQAPPAFGGPTGSMGAILQEFLTAPDDITGTQQALEQAARAAYD